MHFHPVWRIVVMIVVHSSFDGGERNNTPPRTGVRSPSRKPILHVRYRVLTDY